jgi:putative hydrolase
MIAMDLHTHTIASGHGTSDRITDLVKAAEAKGMTALGISEHGPATPGSCGESYFLGLKHAPSRREGIQVLYGAEANILDETGRLDLRDKILAGLDYVIASIHPPTYHTPGEGKNVDENTKSYIRAMSNPYVKIIGHPDDTRYLINSRQLAEAAATMRVLIEINESSLTPGGFRGDTLFNMKEILEACRKAKCMVLLSSDSHGAAHVGEMPRGVQLLRDLNFPQELIMNFRSLDTFLNWRSPIQNR